MQLIRSDIDRIDMYRSSLEEHLSESSGRGADIKTAFSEYRKIGNIFEKSIKFCSTSRHPVYTFIFSYNDTIFYFNPIRCLQSLHSIHRNKPNFYELLGFVAGEVMMIYEEDIESHSHE